MTDVPMTDVDVIVEDAKWTGLDLPGLATRAIAAAAAHQGLAPGEPWQVAVLGCNDARIAVLNADFRGKPQPTNVLSWPSEERGAEDDGARPAPPNPAEPELGDIAIAFETCAREAEEAGKPLADHVTHLVVHGFLHLLGYDHDRDGDAALMERFEAQILGKLGLDDPYYTK